MTDTAELLPRIRAWRAWVSSVSWEEVIGDPHELVASAFAAGYRAGREQAHQEADGEIERLREALNLAASGLVATYATFLQADNEEEALDVLGVIEQVDALVPVTVTPAAAEAEDDADDLREDAVPEPA